MSAFVAGSGSMDSPALFVETAKKAQLLICVDGGARYYEESGILPHVMIGDFDSVEPGLVKAYEQKGVQIIRHSPHKDYTDMELALDYAIEQGAGRIFMMGATGTRLDHTLSNLQLLHKLCDAGVEGVLLDGHNTVYLIEKRIELQRKEGYKVSLIPATPSVKGVTTQGLAYPLAEAAMVMGTGWGISNEFASEKASVEIHTGRLYIMISKD